MGFSNRDLCWHTGGMGLFDKKPYPVSNVNVASGWFGRKYYLPGIQSPHLSSLVLKWCINLQGHFKHASPAWKKGTDINLPATRQLF
jgi:hypothetical protein